MVLVTWTLFNLSQRSKWRRRRKKWKSDFISFWRKVWTRAWPKEFGSRFEWETDLIIKPWRDLPSNGTLKMRFEAQFDCPRLHTSPQLCATPALDQVREIVRTLFDGHCSKSLNLFAICDKSQPNVAVSISASTNLSFTSRLCHQSPTCSSAYWSR